MAALDRYLSRVPTRYRRLDGRSHCRRLRISGGAAIRGRALRPVRREVKTGGTLMTPSVTQARPTAADTSDVATAERLSNDELRKIDAYWRACTYLAAGM